MLANLTFQLLLALLLAALLGMAIGAALMRLKAIHSNLKLAVQMRESTAQLREHVVELEHRISALQRAGSAENQLLSIAKNKESQASAQQDALQVHSRLQSQRISSLEASLLAAEERGLRLQRDFESYKTHKEQELAMSRRLVSEDRIEERISEERNTEQQTDNDLPVLNKRVAESGELPAAGVLAFQNMLEQELDIPTLAESDLPGSINDIEFDFGFDSEHEKPEVTKKQRSEDEADPVG